MPSGFNYLYALDYLNISQSAYNPIGNIDGRASLGDATARARQSQGFQPPQSGYYSYICVYINKVGSPTDNITINLYTDSSGVPSGTLVLNLAGTGSDSTSGTVVASTLDANFRLVPFKFDPPVYLTSGTTYHLSIERSGAADASNFLSVGTDSGANYSLGNRSTYDSVGASWTAQTDDICFYLFPASTDWKTLPRRLWNYRRVGSDSIYISPGVLLEGTPIRIRGLSAIVEPTTETETINLRPEYVDAFALNYLLSGRGGFSYQDNYATSAKIWADNILRLPKPFRPLPANSIRVWQ